MSNIMITGGFGFVGRHLARTMLEKGNKVTVFDVSPGSEFIKDIQKKLNIVVGNLSDWTQVASAIKGNWIDTIYHLGSLLPPMSEQNPSTAFQSNVVGTFNILEAARILDVEKVIFTSSQTTFQPGNAPVSDDSSQRPNTFYGAHKICGERLGEAYWQKYGLNFRGIRYAVVNGPGRDSLAGGQIVVWTCQMAALGKPFELFFTPETVLDTLYVKDAVRLLSDLAEADEAKLTRRVYNLPSLTFSCQEMVDAIHRHLPDADLSFKPSKNMMRMVVNNRLTRKLDSTVAEKDWDASLEYNLDRMVQDYITECRRNRRLIDQPIPKL